MMVCRDVATLLSTDALAEASLGTRLAVRLHLALCRHCRAFARQLETLARLAHGAAATCEAEPSADFEAALTRRLRER